MLWAVEETLGLVHVVQKGTKPTCNKGKANIVVLPHFKNFWLTMNVHIHTYFPHEQKQTFLNKLLSVVCGVHTQ